MPGEWFEWEWDESLFAGSSRYYERGRLPYAPGLADAFRSALGLDGRGRLLDVGCGPGTVTLRVAHLFAEVVGVDADEGMIAEAQRVAAERHVDNARWVHCRAERLPIGLGSFRVITFAASFHWMHRPKVAATARQMLEPGGVIVQADNRRQDSLGADESHPPPPRDKIDELRRAYLGDDRRAGKSVRNSSPDDEDDIFRSAGLEGPEVVVVPDGRTIVRSSDDIVSETFSMSSTAPHLFGARQRDFEADLRRVLADASPSGEFAVRLPNNELKIWRARSTNDRNDGVSK